MPNLVVLVYKEELRRLPPLRELLASPGRFYPEFEFSKIHRGHLPNLAGLMWLRQYSQWTGRDILLIARVSKVDRIIDELWWPISITPVSMMDMLIAVRGDRMHILKNRWGCKDVIDLP